MMLCRTSPRRGQSRVIATSAAFFDYRGRWHVCKGSRTLCGKPSANPVDAGTVRPSLGMICARCLKAHRAARK